MSSIHSILKRYWGFSAFRPLQEDIIRHILDKKDCLALLPTGGGKSVCFQVPALAQPGLCLVVSPLIALMKDQVENLRRKNITAFSIHSGMSRKEVGDTLSVAGNSNCKFLYVSPERLETRLFLEYLPSLGVMLLAIDEAHCISQWGYDFRPAYLQIARLRAELPGVPAIALTASATPAVQDDICTQLHFTAHKVFRQTFERPNLSYSVSEAPARINRILEILNRVEGSAIVYCRSRKRTKEISMLLGTYGVAAEFYHAGLTQEERSSRQENWIRNRTRVIVCTNAFGMGIDKPDVRLVIHADPPDCLENYYQEAGRAGRDGKKSYAVLLYDRTSMVELEQSVRLKFPPPERIRDVYRALMNHLQIPAGSGEGNYYEMDLVEFAQKFNITIPLALATLRVLEQEDLLYFSEQAFLPSRLQVMGDRRSLIEFEQSQPSLDPLLKTLLRTYEGVLDHHVNIYERQIASILKIDTNEITDQLTRLSAYGIVSYTPQKEKPQVFLLHDRVKGEDLTIDTARYGARRKVFEERTATMRNFVYSSELCRSVLIARYFGDNKVGPCGICDNCLAAARKKISADEFRAIHFRIAGMIRSSPMPVQEVLAGIKDLSKDKVWEAIRFLQAEQAIIVSESGILSLRNEPRE